MMTSKTLFLGVYTTNGILRLVFLPACYTLLFTPFFLVILRYTSFGQRLLDHIPKDLQAPDIWPQIFVGLITVLLATRAISGIATAGKDDGKRRVQSRPYWVPAVKHWGSFVFGGERWLKSVRDTSIENIISYNYSGTKHNIVLSSSLLDRIAGSSGSLEEAEVSQWTLLRNAFGFPGSLKSKYLKLQPALFEALSDELFKGQSLKEFTHAFTRNLSKSEGLTDLITFNSSIVDQLPWERVAGAELTDGTEEAECGLFSLVNEFFCDAMIPLITGQQFTESYQLLASDLATFNQHFYALALGLPRLFPLPGLPSASLAKKRLLQNLTKLLNDLTHPPVKREISDDESMSGEETDADVPTPLTKLNELFSKHDLPIPARAAITFELLHRLTTKAVPLAFWTLLHIYKHSASASTSASEKPDQQSSLSAIRKETSNFAEAIQPPSIHPSFPAPPEIYYGSTSPLFNPTALPYLRSCIFESRRLYSAPTTMAKLTKPITVTDTTLPGTEENWILDAGSYLDIGLSQRLINTSPASYLSPETYKPGRYAHGQSPDPLAAHVFDESEELVTAMLLAFVAGVTQLWEIVAAPKKGFLEQMQEQMAEAAAQAAAANEGGQSSTGIGARKEKKVGVWVVPRGVDGAEVLLPASEVRVRIRRREGLPSKRR